LPREDLDPIATTKANLSVLGGEFSGVDAAASRASRDTKVHSA
jgi:hypothetical protein